MEYCSVVWYDNLSQAQSNAIERLHIVAIKIILGRDCPYKGDGHFDYIKAVIICNLDYLFSRIERSNRFGENMCQADLGKICVNHPVQH